MPKQLSFVVDEETEKLMECLKKDLGAKTTASLLRKALALTQLAVDQAKDRDGNLKDALATIALRSYKDEPGENEKHVALRA